MSAGGIQSAGDLTVTAASLNASGITSRGALTVNTAGDSVGTTTASGRVDVTGQVLAAGNVLISGAALQASAIAAGVDFAATDANGGSIVLGSSGTLDLTATTGNIVADKLLSAGDMTVQAALLQANNLISHGNVAITASSNAGIGGAVRVANQLLSAGNTTITSNTGGVGVGLLASGVDFGATKAAGGNIVLASGGDLTVNDGVGAIQAGTVLAAGTINVTGQTITADTITGHKDITLSGATGATVASSGVATTTASGRVSISGQVLGGGNIGVTGSSIAADAIVSGVDIAATDAAGGHITLGPTITGTGNLRLTAAGVLNAGTLLSAGDLNANGATITAGNISAHHDMTLGGATTVSGQILGAGNVLITGPSLSAQTVVAGIDFDATNSAGGRIVLGQAGDLTAAASGDISVSTIEAAGNLVASGTTIAANAVTGHKNIALSGATTVANQVLGGGNVSISGPSIKAGSVVSGVDFARTAAANGNIVLAGSGDLTLSALSALNAGSLLSAGDLSATGSNLTANSVTAHGDMTLGGAINVSGQILGAENVLISGQSLSAQTLVAGIDFSATNAAGGNIVLGQAGSLKATVNGTVTAPTIQAAGAIDIGGASIAADAVTGHKDITLSGTAAGVAVANQVLGGGNVGISGPSIKAGTVVSGVDFASTAAAGGGIVLAGSGDLTLASTGNINAVTLLSAGGLSAAGAALNANAVTAHGDMTLAGAINVNSQILSSGNVLISGQSLSAQTLVAGIDFAATNRTAGNIVLGQTATIVGNRAGDLKVATSGVMAVPTIQAAGTIDIRAATVTSDAITGHKDITVSGVSGPVDVTNQVLGGGNVGISGSSIKAGAIISGVDFAATTAANGHIVQTESGDMSLTAPGAISVGTLLSAGNLSASGAAVAADKVTAHGAMTLAGAINVSGQILSAGNVFISGQSLSAQTVVAGLDFNATDASGGNIVLAQTATIAGNRAGDLTVSVNGAVTVPTIQAAGVLDVSGTSVGADSIISHKDITLAGTTAGVGTTTASGRVDVTNQVLGGGAIGISGSSIKAGAIISGIDFAATAAANGQIVQTASGDMSLTSPGTISAGTLLTAGNLSASGGTITADKITAHHDITLGGVISVSGQILVAGNVLISGQSLSAQTIVAGLDFNATDAAGGRIVLGSSGDLTVSINGAVAAPTMQAAGAIDISGTSLTADSITGQRNITLAGTAAGGVGTTSASGRVDVTNQVLGRGNVSISGRSINTGAVVSGVDFARTAAANGNIVLASSGDLTLASTGAVNAGTLLSAGSLTATGTVITVDVVTAHGNIALDGAISVASQILGAGNVLISGQSLSARSLIAGIDFDATNRASGDIVLGQTGDLTVSVSGAVAVPTIQAAGAVDVSGATIDANAVTSYRNMTLSGATTVSNQVLGGDSISISGAGIKVGTVVSGVDFARTAAANGNIVQTASGDLTLVSAGTISAGTLLSAGGVNASGAAVTAAAVTAHGNATLNGAITISGQILGAGNVLITGQSLSAQTVVAGIDFAATNAAGGNIVLGQAATIAGNHTGDLTVSVNGAVAAPIIQAAGDIDVSGASVAAASITGHKDVTLSGAAADGVAIAKQLLGGGDVSISGTSIKAGTVVSGVDFTATSAGGGNIVLTASGDLTLVSTGLTSGGTLLSAGALSAKGSTVTADSITAHGNVTLDGATIVGGQILAAGDVLISGQSLAAQAAIAGIDFAATNAAGGNIVLGNAGKLTVSVSGDVAASTMQAAGTVDASGATITADTITGHKDIALSGATTIHHQILGGGDVAISGSGIRAGAIVSGVDFARTAAANGDIVLASSGDLTLASAGNIDAGALLSAGDLSTSGAAVSADAVTAHGAVTLNGATTVTGQVLSAGNVLVTGQSLSAQTIVAGIDFTASKTSGGNIVVDQTGGLTAQLSGELSASTMEAAGAINVNATTVTADSITGHKNITLAGTTTVNGQVLGGGNISVSGPSITAGAIVSGVDFAGTAAANGNIVQTMSGDISLTSTGGLTVGTLLSAGGLTAQAMDLAASSITSHGKTDLKANGTAASGRVNVSGQVLSASDLTISANSLKAGLLVSGVDFAATNRNGGNIVLGSSGATEITVSGNATAGTILSAGDFTAKAATLQGTSITGHGKVGVVGNVDVTSQILAAGDLALNGGDISAPTLISGIDFTATNAAGGNIVLAQSGAMNLTATGNIASQTILSAGDITANAVDLIAGSITAHGNAGIVGNVDVSNQIIAAGNLTISGGHINAPTLISGIDFAATNAAGGGIVLGAAATITGNRAGDMNLTASGGITTQTMLSAGVIDAHGTTITANAVTGHGNIDLAGSSSVNVTGQLLGAGDVSLSGPTVELGQAVTGVDFAATAQSINGAIVLGPSGDLTISAGSASAGTLIVAGSLNATASAFTGGNITGHGAVAIGSSTSPGAVKINGQLLGASNVSITGSDISGNAIVAGVDFAATGQSATGNIVLGQAATIAGKRAGDLTLAATSGNVAVSSLMAAGNLTANAANNVSANAVAHGDLTIGAGNAITLSGQSLSNGNVNLNARSITIDTLVSGVDFAATNASSNGSLMLRRAGTMTLAASNGSVSANSLLSGGNLAATATQNISYNSLQSLGNAALTSPGAIAYTSTTRVGGNLTLNTGVLDLSGSRGSRIAGGGMLIVNASSANLSSSNLVFGGLTLNLSGNADLSNAQVSTVTNAGGSGDISISAAGLTTNANTALLAAHDLTLNLLSLGNAGQLAAGNNLNVNIAGDFANTPSGLVFAGNNANFFVGGTLANNQGALLAGNGLTIAGASGSQRNGAVVNSAGLIQSGGGMSILTNGLSNVTTSAPAIQRNVLISDDVLHAYDLITDSGTKSGLVHQLVLQDQLISGAGASAQIRAGAELTINATNLWNSYSSIKSDGNMLLTVAGALTNDGATLNRISELTCNSSTPCQYYPDKAVETTTLNCSGPNRPCIENTTTTYVPNPNGRRDPSKDLNPGTTVNGVAAIGAISGVIQTRGALAINGGGSVNNVASNGSISGGVAIAAPATSNNPLGALSSMTAGGALFNVSAALSNVAANGGANASAGPSLVSNGPTIGSGPAISSNLRASGSASISGVSLTASNGVTLSQNSVTAATGPSINGSNLTTAGNANVSSSGLTVVGGASVSTNGPTAATGSAIGGGGVTAAPGSSISNSSVTAATGPAIGGNTLTAAGASVSPNSLMGKLTAAIGNSGNLAQILQTNGAQLAAVAKPQSGGVGGTAPGQVFLFETRAAFLDVSKFYGSAYFIDRVGYTPETKVPFLGDAYFDNQLIDEQMRQLVGNGLGAGSFVPGDNATDQMKTLLDKGVAYAEAHGLGLGQPLTPEQAASLTQSMVIYQTEVVDGAPVLVPVVYLSAADRAKTTSAVTIAGNTVSIDAGSVDNSGVIAAADGMTINANSIKANGGAFLAGGNMNLNAENGITLAAQTMNIGGQTIVTANGGVTAGGNLKMDAGAGSLTLSGTKVAAGGSAQLSGQTVTLGAVKQDNGGVQTLVGTTVTTGGNLNIAGTNGVNVIASSAKVGGDLSILSSSGSVSIISAGVQNTMVDVNRGTITTTTSQIQQGSSLIAGGAMLVSGNQGVLIGGSTLEAGGNLGLVSTNGNIAITASQDQTASQSKTTPGSYNGYKGGQSSSTALTSNGSSITSGNGSVSVQTDNGNISVIGSDIDAKGGTANLIAKGDVTIGEAINSASSSSSSGKKKASEATTTAQGSSISGQTGVNIASTGGNVTISASDVAAGDAAHTADANILAAGNIIIASGKDTKETTTDSKKSGFLSSSKTHTHTYDEDTVGSSISASGNVNVAASGETVVSGSNIAAGNNLSLSGSTVTVMGAEESHESDKQVKKSGIGVGSGGGFVSIYGSHSKSTSESSTDNAGSTLSAANGNITLNATKGDLNIIGSSITATNGDVNGQAAGDINILPGHESDQSSKSDKRSGFGIQVSTSGGGASIGIGVGRFTDQVNQSAETNAVSTIKAGGDITLKAGDTFNDQAGQIAAGGGVTIVGKNGVNILSGNDITNFDEVATSFFAGVSVGVSSSFVGAGQSIENLASKLGNVTDGYSAANVAFAGMRAYDALSSLKDGINAGNLASVSLTAGFTYSKNETSVSTSTPVLPTISGSSVDISTNGDFTSRGLQISATANADHADDPMNGSVLISANTIDMAGAQATSSASSSSKSAGASIGVSVGVGIKGATGITPTASVSAGQSKSSNTSTTQVISTVSATDNITFISKGDTALNNTVFSADTIDGKIGGNLNIVSTPNTGSQSNSSASLGFSFTGPTIGNTAGQPLLTAGNIGTALGGLMLGGVQPGFGSGKGSTNWIDTPAGLYSTGDQTITVGGNTNLAASGLISTDGEVNLDTGTLTWSDFVGTQKYQGYEINADIDLYSGTDANGKNKNNSSASGKYQLDDVEQSVKATISSGGAAGNITIRNPEQQASLEQSGQTRPVDEINTDPSKQNVITKDKHIDLEPYVSVQSVTAALDAGKTIAQVLGDAFAKMAADGKVSPADAIAAQAILRNVTDPAVLKGLAQCRQQGAGTCVIETRTEIDSTMSGLVEVTITPSLADQILNAIATGVAVGKRITGAGGAVGVLFAALFYPNSAGGYEVRQKIDINAPGVPGATAELSGNSDGLGRVLTITTSSGDQTKFMLLPTGNANQYQLIFAADASSNPIAADKLAGFAAFLSAYTAVNVVYNQTGKGGDGRPLYPNDNYGPKPDDGASAGQPNGGNNNGGGPQIVVPVPNNGNSQNNNPSGQDIVTIESGKWDYFFGRVDSNPHNQDRSLQMQQQFARIGIYDNSAGRTAIADALQKSANTPGSVIETFSQTAPNGSVQNFEVVEGLLMGPGGGLKLTSTFEIMSNGGKRLVTTIPKGGP
ncbi:hemagglutinin repeat-containing protein [Rhizobium sp. A22-96]